MLVWSKLVERTKFLEFCFGCQTILEKAASKGKLTGKMQWREVRIFANNFVEVIDRDNLLKCSLCPRGCGANRIIGSGVCKSPGTPLVSSVVVHRGEEPVLSGEKGMCNVFFAHCNLQCVYCQNHQISRNTLMNQEWRMSVNTVAEEICRLLSSGIKMLGFVSPSHQVVQMLEIIELVKEAGYSPRIIYNSNGYDSVDTLRQLEELVDVYLPDFKYINPELGKRFSGVDNYPDVAVKAIREMYRQKGSSLLVEDGGLVESGMIIRHLVLPGFTGESIKLLRFLADEFSPRIHLSLMSQYYPPAGIELQPPLNRTLTEEEYMEVVEVAQEIGFRGWIQDTESFRSYQPDFSRSNPFE